MLKTVEQLDGDRHRAATRVKELSNQLTVILGPDAGKLSAVKSLCRDLAAAERTHEGALRRYSDARKAESTKATSVMVETLRARLEGVTHG